MMRGKASWTAEMTAVFRAAESIRPEGERLFCDPHAAGFLRPSFRWLLKNRHLALFALWLMIDRRFPGASVTIACRIRFVDDCLNQSIQEGIDQVVILGAGYDARAYRFGELERKRVFEVDHPDTQRRKRSKVIRAFGRLPAHVVHVPVDFETDDLMQTLAGAGYRSDLKTFFIWEGVSKYLTSDAVNGLLSAVAGNAGQGSAIVFDYLFRSMVDGRAATGLTRRMLAFQARKGEPFIFGLPETDPDRFVLSSGFSVARNFTATHLKALYLADMARARDLHPFWGMMIAVV